MVPTKRRFALLSSWDSSSSGSSSSSVEVAAPPKKLRLSTRTRTKSVAYTLAPRKRKKSHPDPYVPSSKVQVAAAPPKKLKLSSSTSQLDNNNNTTPDWLPDGWTVVVLARAAGNKYKVYKETATGKKLYSKPQVLNYLGIADTTNSNKTKVKVAPPKEKQVKVAPPQKKQVKVAPAQKKQVSSTLSTVPSEIPKSLYDLIQDAAEARKSLKLNSNNVSAKRKVKSLEDKIRRLSIYCQCITEELAPDWRYDPETSFAAHVPKTPAPPKPKTIKKKKKKTAEKKEIQITWETPNYHGSYPLNNKDDKNVWNSFKEDEATEAVPYMSVSVDKYLKMVDKDHMVVDLLGKFAVDTFNRSCQMYVNEDEDNQVSGAEFMECKFYKLTSKYIFYMTIEAIEQGIPGVYETRVECDTEDGAKRLMNFMLTDRKPKWNRPWVKPQVEPEVEYETVQDGSSDPQDFYELTGMVHRETEGGGFDYHNTFFSPHTLVYTIRGDDDFAPNLSQPLEFPAATKTIPVDR